MIDDSLQFQIHCGSEDAFLEMSRQCAKDIYLTALNATGDPLLSRGATKNALLRLKQCLVEAEGPIDTDAALSRMLEEEIGMSIIPVPVLTESDAAPKAAPAPKAKKAKTPEARRPANPPSSPGNAPGPEATKQEETPLWIDSEDEEEAPGRESVPSRRISGGSIALILVAVLFILIFLWILVGLLIDLYILPPVDLGYTWFNRHVFLLFRMF